MLPIGALKDQVAVITGGGTGLGKAMAGEFGRLGAKLVLASRKTEHLEPTAEELRKKKYEVLTVQMDVRKPEDVDRMVVESKKAFGKIDILVNNAAGNFIAPAETLSVNGWNSVVNIVLNGTFYCSRAVGLDMISSGKGGKILNIVATYAWTGGPGTIHSACAKAGVLTMTQTLGVEWARYKIRVNAIAPGPIKTEGAWRQLVAGTDAEQMVIKHNPMRRLGTTEELAWLASYLVSDYSDWVNGEVVTIDGGEWLNKGIFHFIQD